MFVLLLACATPPSSLPLLQAGEPQPLEPAEVVAAADLDGDGRDEIIRVRDGKALWRDQQVDLGGLAQAVSRGDIDGDGREEALIATGIGRGMPDVPARLWSIGDDGGRILWERDGPRNQVADLHVVDGAPGQPDRVFLVAFTDARTTTGGWLVDGRLEPLHEASMALRMQPLGPDLVVGRLYGDAPKTPGDLRLIDARGEDRPLSAHRGIRSLASGDLDGDGSPELLVGDGWHYAYGEHAQPTLRLFPEAGVGQPRVIARLDGSYAIEEIEVAQPPDGGPAVILATGSSSVVLLQRDALGWAPTTIGRVEPSGNAVIAHDDDTLSVVVSGRPATRVPLTRPSTR